jgi:hypothetical protein
MAKRYQGLIELYCALRSVAVPPGFGRNAPGRYAIIRTDFSPPKLVATTWRKVADVVYYIERFLVPELGDSISQSVRILDFRERRELVYVGERRLRETATFSTGDETNE